MQRFPLYQLPSIASSAATSTGTNSSSAACFTAGHQCRVTAPECFPFAETQRGEATSITLLRRRGTLQLALISRPLGLWHHCQAGRGFGPTCMYTRERNSGRDSHPQPERESAVEPRNCAAPRTFRGTNGLRPCCQGRAGAAENQRWTSAFLFVYFFCLFFAAGVFVLHARA